MQLVSPTFIPLSFDAMNCNPFTFLRTLPTSLLIKPASQSHIIYVVTKKNSMNDNAQQEQHKVMCKDNIKMNIKGLD